MHDRQFGGAGIAEQMRDALVLEQCKECRAAGNAIHEGPPLPAAVTVGSGTTWPMLRGEIKEARSWLPCIIALDHRVPDAVQRFFSGAPRPGPALAYRDRTRPSSAALC